MWRLTLLSLLFVGVVSPTLSVRNRNGSLPGHSTVIKSASQNAWYPGVSLLSSVGGPSSNHLTTPSNFDAVIGERQSVDLELEVWCVGDQLTLGVGVKLNGVELIPEALTLGNGCKSNGLSADYLWFTYDLTQCATSQSVLNGNMVYSNFLQYAPDPLNPALQQVEFFSLPVHCTLDRRRDYASPVTMSVPVSTKRLDSGFSLRAMNSFRTSVAESVYQQGQAIHLQATVEQIGEEQQLYVHSCHANMSPDSMSRPRVRLITKKGCVAYVVSKRGHAKFDLSESMDAVNFMFVAFRFAAPEIYIHCELAVLDQTMTPASKFCNYNQKKQRWEELSGDIAVCSCCRTACKDTAPSSVSSGLHALVSIGPLIIENRTSAAGDADAKASSPPSSELPVAIETTTTTPSPPLAFLELSQPGFPEVPPEDWLGQFVPDAVAFLDGFPVQEEVWGEQPHDAPQGWLSAGAGSTRVTWVYPPVLANGGVLIVKHVPEEPGMDVVVGYVPVNPIMESFNRPNRPFGARDSLASPQNDDDNEIMQRYPHHDDVPSAQEFWRQDFPENGRFPSLTMPVSDPDPVLEESGRKLWGVDLEARIQQGSGPHPGQNWQQPELANRKAGPLNQHGEAENPLDGVALDDEGLVVQRTEVVMHKGRGQTDAAVLTAFRSRLALTRSDGAAQKLRYEEEEGRAEEDGAMKRRVLLEEDNVRPSSLRDVLRRMYKAE